MKRATAPTGKKKGARTVWFERPVSIFNRYQFVGARGDNTPFTTWITPFDCMTSACVT